MIDRFWLKPMDGFIKLKDGLKPIPIDDVIRVNCKCIID